MPLQQDNEEHVLTDDASGCTCDECGETYIRPVLATVMSQGASQSYYACPRCLTKVGEIRTQKKEETRGSLPIDVLSRSATKLENDVKCQHFLGYLKRRPKDMAIPDECLTCTKMVECLYLQ